MIASSGFIISRKLTVPAFDDTNESRGNLVSPLQSPSCNVVGLDLSQNTAVTISRRSLYPGQLLTRKVK